MGEIKRLVFVDGVDVTAPTASGSGGGGLLNLNPNPDAEAAVNLGDTNGIGDYVASGTGVTAARTADPAEIPLSPVKTSAIKLTLSDDLGGNEYVALRLLVPESAKNRKLGLLWWQLPNAYTSGDLKVQVFKNSASDFSGSYTEVPIDGITGGIEIAAVAGDFGPAGIDWDDSDALEIRWVNNGGTSGHLSLSDVTVTPSKMAALRSEQRKFQVTGLQATGLVNNTNTDIGSDTLTLPPGDYTITYGARSYVQWSSAPSSIAVLLSVTTASNATLANHDLSGHAQYDSDSHRNVTSTTARVTLTEETTIKLRGAINVVGGTIATRDITNGFIVAERDPESVYTTPVGRQSPLKAGLIMAWPSDTVPPGWLECDGSAVSRSQYADLFAAIGTTYGAGDGSTTFNLPDYRGYFLRGQDGGAGVDPNAATRTNRGDGQTGDKVGTKQTDAYAQHNHSMTHTHSIDHDHPSVNTSSVEHSHNVTLDRKTTIGSGPHFGWANTTGAGLGQTSYPSEPHSHSHSVNLPNYTGTSGPSSASNTGNSGGSETRPKNIYVKWIIKAYNDSVDLVGFGLANENQAGLVSHERYAAAENVSSTSGATGTLTWRATRVGRSVTVTVFGNITGITSDVSSFVGVIPEWARPDLGTLVQMAGVSVTNQRIYTVTLSTAGNVGFGKRIIDGNGLAASNFANISTENALHATFSFVVVD